MRGIPVPVLGILGIVSQSRTLRFRPMRLSGRRNEYLIALTARFADPRAASVMDCYEEFASAAVNAELPQWFYIMVWQMSALLALPKPTPAPLPAGHPSPARPIALGEVNLGVICTAAIQAESAEFAAHLSPQQVSIVVREVCHHDVGKPVIYSLSFDFAELRFCYVALHSSREAAADARSSRGEAGRCA